MNLREAAQQALETLEAPWAAKPGGMLLAINNLRVALKEQSAPKQFMYFENQEGGMNTFMVSSEQDLHRLYGWMKTDCTFDCSHEDQEMVDWMRVAEIGDVRSHRLGYLVCIKDKK
jgi:hypothetical protein